MLFWIVSCKSTHETKIVPLQEMSQEDRLNLIIQSGLQYNTLSSSLKLTIMQFKGAKNISVDAQLRIIRNEAIQLSLRIPLIGTEAAKILITPDRILIIDRLNKQYLYEPLQDILSKASIDFDYYSLEALLTNRLFIAGKKELIPLDYLLFNVQEDGYHVNISHTGRQNIQYDFVSDYSDHIQTARISSERKSPSLLCEYTSWNSISGKNTFPMLIAFTFNTQDTYKLSFSFRSVDVNPDFSIDYSIPNKYRQISIQQVIKFIDNLL
ncbi:MAG: DUF4292 domain-containing protein [Candidatus Azobacteroides sp.]|nr:DUF4292 domain-containing protein [Candidatus Azobacteroides sp.]